MTGNWSESSFIGRSESVWNYEKGNRDISFTLKLYAQTPLEISLIYEKLNLFCIVISDWVMYYK